MVRGKGILTDFKLFLFSLIWFFISIEMLVRVYPMEWFYVLIKLSYLLSTSLFLGSGLRLRFRVQGIDPNTEGSIKKTFFLCFIYGLCMALWNIARMLVLIAWG